MVKHPGHLALAVGLGGFALLGWMSWSLFFIVAVISAIEAF